jgi:hypothetical protein
MNLRVAKSTEHVEIVQAVGCFESESVPLA